MHFRQPVRLGQCRHADGAESMKELQELNTQKDSASDPMIMFLCINSSGLTLIPVSIMTYRAQMGAANPADVFLPLMLATFSSTGRHIGGLLQATDQHPATEPAAFLRRDDRVHRWSGLAFRDDEPAIGLPLLHPVCQHFAFLYYMWIQLSAVSAKNQRIRHLYRRRERGFQTAVTIIPYLIAVLVAIAVFRASGAMDFLIDGIRMGVSAAGLDTQFVEGLPTMLMKPLSGSGARGMMLDAMNTYGADSFIGRLCSIVQGSSDTTFYVVALYFGSVGIRNTYYTIPCSLLADLAGAVAAVTMTYLFFT